MEKLEVQEEFKQILEFAIQRGNEDSEVTVQQLVAELTMQLRPLFNNEIR